MLENLCGKYFGKWKVIEESKRINGRLFSLCECQCDKNTIRLVRNDQLKSGKSSGCGCFKIKHGMSYDRIYKEWYGMNYRCYQENCSCYDRYGGRGISVCKEWNKDNQDSLNNFTKWALENGYSNNLSIERIDVNGNYEPSNCTWITMKKQANNKRNTVRIPFEDGEKTLCDLSRESNIKRETILNRYNKGYSGKDLVFDGIINNTSGIIGISYSNSQNNWRAYINQDGKRIELGRRKDKEKAIKLRLEAELKLYGENSPQFDLFDKYGIGRE